MQANSVILYVYYVYIIPCIVLPIDCVILYHYDFYANGA